MKRVSKPKPAPKPKTTNVGRTKKEIVVDPATMVFELAAMGHSKREIGVLLDVNDKTVANRFNNEYIKGAETGKMRLRQKLMSEALAGNTAALIFACKAILGMSDKQQIEISGPNQQPIGISVHDAIRNPVIASAAANFAEAVAIQSSGSSGNVKQREMETSETPETPE